MWARRHEPARYTAAVGAAAIVAGWALAQHPATAALAAVRPGLTARAAVACLVAGLALLNLADARWAHAVGVASLFAFVGFGFAAVRPGELAGGPCG